MPPTTASPEKAETPPAVAPPARGGMMSPIGYAVTGVLLLATVGGTWWVVKSFSRAPEAKVEELGPHTEVFLGKFVRELAPDPQNMIREPFMVEVRLVLNPRTKHLDEVKAKVAERTNLLKDLVWTEILYAKSDAELRKARVVETLKAEIRERANTALGRSKDGQDAVDRVIFSDIRLPSRK
jgi:flagellar basal body-associated protein FliL